MQPYNHDNQCDDNVLGVNIGHTTEKIAETDDDQNLIGILEVLFLIIKKNEVLFHVTL